MKMDQKAINLREFIIELEKVCKKSTITSDDLYELAYLASNAEQRETSEILYGIADDFKQKDYLRQLRKLAKEYDV